MKGYILEVTRVLGTAGLLFLLNHSVQADPVADFYRGKQITLGVGAAPGDGYDAYARLLARFFTKHVPGNPSIVVVNVPGAGSLTLLNRLLGTAPRDGTYIAAVYRGVPFEPALKRFPTNISIQQVAELNWLGSMDANVAVVVNWSSAPQRSFTDLYNSEMIVGGAGPTGTFETTANMLRNLVGMNLRIISGYPGSQDAVLAMQRGEIQGLVDWDWSTIKVNFPHLLSEKKIRLLAQISSSEERHPELPDVPTLAELLDFKTHETLEKVFNVALAQKQMGRPYVAPAGVPPERVAALRAAFLATLNDPEFIAAASKSRFSIVPVSGQQVGAVVDAVLKYPEGILSLAGRAMSAIEGPPGQLKGELVKLGRP